MAPATTSIGRVGDARPAEPRVAVVGAGAVGSFFGGLLARAGVAVTLIGRREHVAAIESGGLEIDSATHGGRVAVSASTDMAAVSDAGVILVATKTVDTESAAREIARHASPRALVVSLQNGIENAPEIHAIAGLRTVAAAVYVAVQVSGPGRLRHLGRGDLVLGTSPTVLSGASEDDVAFVASLFERAGVPCRVVADVAPELWAKLTMNCAYNAISALTRRSYGDIAADPGARAIMQAVVGEVVAVASASGVRLDEAELVDAAMGLGVSMRDTLSSTAHDLARGRRTEIDALNGFVARRARELAVAAPVNATLSTLVRLAEGRPAR